MGKFRVRCFVAFSRAEGIIDASRSWTQVRARRPRTFNRDRWYTVTGQARHFATKQARDQFKSNIDTHTLVLATSSVSDIHEQLYTELKNGFESYEDAFESSNKTLMVH